MCKIRFRRCGVERDGWLRRVHVRPWHLLPGQEKCTATAPTASTPSPSTTIADSMSAATDDSLAEWSEALAKSFADSGFGCQGTPAKTTAQAESETTATPVEHKPAHAVAQPTITASGGAQPTGPVEDDAWATREPTRTATAAARLTGTATSSQETACAPTSASQLFDGVPESDDARYKRLIAELYKLHNPSMMWVLPSVYQMHAGNLERAYSEMRHKYEAGRGTVEADAGRPRSHAGGRAPAGQPGGATAAQPREGATPSQKVWNRHRTETMQITVASASFPPLFPRGFLEVTANNSVRSLKHLVCERTQQSTCRQTLLCKGTCLEQDDFTLAFYNVRGGDEVYVVDRGVRPQLRFCVGARVECCVQAPGGFGLTWQTGTVSAQWYRETYWPEHVAHPYQVALDTGLAVTAPQDVERFIRKVETITIAAVWSDRVESLEAGLDEPIGNLKARVVQLANLDPMLGPRAKFWLGGETLVNEWPVSAYRRPTLRGSRHELTNGSTLLLTTHEGSSEVGHSRPMFRISIDTPFSHCYGDDSDDDVSGNIDLKVFHDETIRSVKARTMRETRAHEHPDAAHVLFLNEHLAESRSLRECGVHAGGKLQIILR